jgi:hypothetical protein
MIRRFCDFCAIEMDAIDQERLAAKRDAVRGKPKVGVEVVVTVDGTTNAGDICHGCIVDIVALADRRPKKG